MANAMPTRWTRVRILMCGLVFGLMAFWVGRRAFELQVTQADRLAEYAEENSLRDIEIPPRRGRIFDRNGKELAATVEVDSVFCNPRLLLGTPDGVRKLARALGMDGRELKTRLATRRYFSWVKRGVTPEESAAVKALALPGVAFRREPRRFYPLRTLGSTVIGHAGVDGRGLEGVELAYDEHLRGTSVTVPGLKDALGRELLIDGVTDTSQTAGKDVVLALDSYLQLQTEVALQGVMEKHNARSATAVMMDVRTGEVLAMASLPLYNPNDPRGAVAAGARNRAVADQIEPGSTMKTFTFAAVLDAGRLRPDDRFDCQMGRMQVGKYTIRDTHPLGVLTAAETFQHSSNICTVKIARRIGKEALNEALERFGMGKVTGIGLPGEARGNVRPLERWGEIGFANIAFGQGLAVTPLQMVAGYTAIAAGGIYRPPRLAMRVVHPDGHEEALPLPVHARPERRVMSEGAARTLLTIMRRVTEEGGTAKQAAFPGYPVAGKTGTAQKVHNGRYDPDRWIASFIGVVPADSPRLVIGVTVDEPRPIHLGGAVAAPAFREIAEAAVKYLSIPPTQPVVAKVDKAAPARAPADEREGPGSDEPLGDELDAADDDDTVVAAAPLRRGHEREDGTIEEEEGTEAVDEPVAPARAERVTVPDFVGMSMGEAIRAARRAGIEIWPEGSGIAVAQVPAVKSLPRGAGLRVEFRSTEARP